MSAQVCILTPDPAGPGSATRWSEVLARLAAPLRAAGIAVQSRPWSDAGSLSGFGIVMPLLAWGYHQAGARWPDQVAAWEQAGVRLGNPAGVLRWNADKVYLRRLEAAGAPVVPTLFVDRVSEASMADAALRFGTGRLIAKPRVSASAWRTIRWSPGVPLDDGPPGAAMIQPYLPAIEEEGEVSLLHFDKTFSHAIRKRPRIGDFRTQPEFGAIIESHEAAPDELEAARSILDAVDEPLLYARVDLIRSADGKPRLMELELVEPDLYLEHDRNRGAAFLAAVAEAAR